MENEGRGTRVQKLIGEEQVSFLLLNGRKLGRRSVPLRRARVTGVCSADAMTLPRHEMSLCTAYRSFAIYLIIVSVISESPVSAFTIRRMRTTTLRPLDLTGEESALLEVKSDLSKLNNVRDNDKYGREKLTIRKSVNFLTPDKKLASNSRQRITTAVLSPLNNEELLKASDETSTRDTETTTGFDATEISYTKKYRILDTVRENKPEIKTLLAESNNTKIDAARKINEDNGRGRRQGNLLQNKTHGENQINKPSEISTSIETTTYVTNTEEIKTTLGEVTTFEIPVDVISTTIVDENEQETTNDIKEENNTSQVTQVDTISPQADTTTETVTSGVTETENTATDATDQTESMVGQSSKTSSKSPLWKKYKIIERKRIPSTTESENKSTEELVKAESVSSTVNIDNTNSVPQEQLLKEQQELTSNLKTNKNKEDDTGTTVTTLETTYILEPEIKQASTQSMGRGTPISTDTVESKRAGYLDLTSKQSTTAEEIATTVSLDDLAMYNETELLGSIFEIDTPEDGPEGKNSTIVESQSQLVDDALKEELLKEQVLNDHVENSKRLEEQQDQDKVRPLDSNDGTDDTLSVKPITHGKGGLYAVSSNYKKMKKIEVQPSKPFVRHPDDNSWRNESLTSLGIVFKAKNASKPFTQVLKNKTEAELNNLVQSDRDNNNEVPDLRQRLEKIAEVRKSRKKKVDKYGDTIYGDYEESGELSSTPKTDTVSIPIMEVEGELFFVPSTTSSPVPQATQRTTTPGVYMYSEETVTTKKPKKPQKFHEYYDTTDEYDADYLSLAKIDLKKFTTRLFSNEDKTTSTTTTTITPILTPFTEQVKMLLPPERKATLQYFPPREHPPQKVNVNDYDNDFQRKVNMYSQEKPPRIPPPVTRGTPPPATVIHERPIQYSKPNVIPQFPMYKPGNLDKNVYVTFPPQLGEHANKYPSGNDESFNRASYVIKHYRDLIDEAVKDDYDKSGELMPAFTEAPLVGVTVLKARNHLKHMDEDYDYDANFRKDILNRFVDNFNQNSERFKVDFPILYNNTVVHMKAQENGKVVASSSAFMKRLYGEAQAQARAGAGAAGRACEPHCDARVELSPAYELHYYVPDQEERQEAALKPATLPFSYRL